ncbi:DUF72 domain-containing protein [Paludisphaera mucosa]|uniref:DUF72 domain-containing protein n=1 Tax=Paludisphaera mucosa TaxID=3030827 RepID=A0ABT6F564_9BACT|nr:DUF72 domain-containing protein [Paludisphaera mucosa]MDG3002694.1 DUF72 domain-containing protein [Paludisphaera mucosa]
MELHVGTSGYSYKEWKGGFYPSKLPASGMLRYYGERFGAVEINGTFRVLPAVATVQRWADAVPADFRFVLKAPQRITHTRRLKDCGEPLAQTLEVAGALKERLGPLLFQLPPNMKKDAPRLQAFLGLLPASIRSAFEFRHASWFDDEVFGLLREHNSSLCLADADCELDVPFVPTADWGYLRLRRFDYSDAELAAWVQRVAGQAWREVFVFFKHEDEGKGPRMAARYRELAAAL